MIVNIARRGTRIGPPHRLRSDAVQLTGEYGQAIDANVDPALWGAAAYLGGLRTASNDARRRTDQDRGHLGNLVVDLQGVLGELIVLQAASKLAGWTASHALFDAAGGGSTEISGSVDVTLSSPPSMVPAQTLKDDPLAPVKRPARCFRIEAKCHLDLTQALLDEGLRPKADFAVNRQAVLDSASLDAHAVVCIAASPGRGLAVRGRMLPIADVLEWEAVDYRRDSLALRLPLSELSPVVWGASWAEVRRRIRDSDEVISLDTLREAHAAGRGDYAEWARTDRRLPADPQDAIATLTTSGREAVLRRRGRA